MNAIYPTDPDTDIAELDQPYIPLRMTPVPAGVTIRDWFAARALTVVIGHYLPGEEHLTAYRAYAIADAMLEKRDARIRPSPKG